MELIQSDMDLQDETPVLASCDEPGLGQVNLRLAPRHGADRSEESASLEVTTSSDIAISASFQSGLPLLQ